MSPQSTAKKNILVFTRRFRRTRRRAIFHIGLSGDGSRKLGPGAVVVIPGCDAAVTALGRNRWSPWWWNRADDDKECNASVLNSGRSRGFTQTAGVCPQRSLIEPLPTHPLLHGSHVVGIDKVVPPPSSGPTCPHDICRFLLGYCSITGHFW